MLRRTKIVATLGPATDVPLMLDKIIMAGVDVARLNFSHGDRELHVRRASQVRQRAKELNRWVGILADLQGPKIRIERFAKGPVELREGAGFILDASLGAAAGNEERVGITYKELPGDLASGDILLLDDGRIVLRVENIKGGEIFCLVQVGGELSDNKGINRQGGGLSSPALTEKDREDIKVAAEIDADYLAVSFPRSAADIDLARRLLREAGGHGGIIAKIERAEALNNIESIIDASEAVMIARGDLGVEIGDAALPPAQKLIIRLARDMNRVVITATQMMESMINNQMPSRAEVFDVANAVLDGTDAVMLSGETAIGQFPDKVVAAMHRICLETEKQQEIRVSDHRIHSLFGRVDEAVSMAAMYVANHLEVKAIAALTESGDTPLWMSRISSGIPIYALTKRLRTRRRVTLFRGVYPASFRIETHDHARVNQEAVDELLRRKVVREGDLVIITKGDLTGVQGGTNTMKIVRIGDLAEPRD